MLVDLVDVDTGTPVEVSPRRILQRQVEAAAELGYMPMIGSEVEFFVFREPLRRRQRATATAT